MPTALDLLFGLSARVTRRTYFVVGALLMLLKYAIDAALVFAVAGRFWSPLSYLSPLISMRGAELGHASDTLLWAMALVALPFLWIGVSMSMRRCLDAGRSAWLALLFFVPGVNYLFMIAISLVPSRPGISWPLTTAASSSHARLRTGLYGVAVGVGVALVMTGFSVFVVGSYGAVLFFATPFIIGATSAYLHNRQQPRSVASSLVVATISITLAGLSILLFALEGVVCLVMAMPIAYAAAVPGALLGRMVAQYTRAPKLHAVMAVLVLPLAAAIERTATPLPQYEVRTAITIDAPPEAVWRNVVGFSELTAPPQWFFRLGIAYPQHATIVGSGVGAVRRCEFSTGAFVEPITDWDEPHRLGFDVAEQPPPMTELSPYQVVNAPHLLSALRSRRGEFRLTRLPNGGTKLEGSTWYTLDMAPSGYWRLWSEALLHAIHRRVLAHIKTLSESGAS